jgi:hypothetical protein
MKATRWKVFKDADGFYLATTKGKPSKRMQTKDDADRETLQRNARLDDWDRAVAEGKAGSLPIPSREA